MKLTNKNEAKEMAKLIECNCKLKFNSKTCNSKQKWNNKICQRKCKIHRKCKSNYIWNPSTFICENSNYLKSIGHVSVSECAETIFAVDIVPIKKKNNITTKKANLTPSTNCHRKKVRDWIKYQILAV